MNPISFHISNVEHIPLWDEDEETILLHLQVLAFFPAHLPLDPNQACGRIARLSDSSAGPGALHAGV